MHDETGSSYSSHFLGVQPVEMAQLGMGWVYNLRLNLLSMINVQCTTNQHRLVGNIYKR